jgi:hypothetical protein
MMKCPICESLVENDAATCWNCSAEFVVSETGNTVAQDDGVVVTRSNGGALIAGGWVMIVLAALGLLLGVTTLASPRSVSGAASSWFLTVASVAIFQIGLLLAIAGYIVRAIWFLPGEEQKRIQR